MESKNLRIIQKIVQITRIVSIVAFYGCIVGAGFYSLGVLTMGIFKLVGSGFSAISGFFGVTGLDVNGLGTAPVAFLDAAIVCGAFIFLAFKMKNFLERELEVGTPFSYEIAKEMRFMGILFAAFGIGISWIVAFINMVAHFAVRISTDLDVDFTFSGIVVFGAMLVFLSFVCQYGAELNDK